MPANNAGKASPGSPFIAPPATIWNNMVDAGRAWADGQLNNGAPTPNRSRPTDLVRIKNDCGVDRARGEILLISGKAITELSEESIWLLGDTPAADGYFAILKEPIQSGDIGVAQVSGCCLAKIDIRSTSHNRARQVSGQYTLESAADGPIEITHSPGTTGEVECVVRFAGGGSVFGFKITTAMASRAGVCSIYLIDDIDYATAIDTGEPINSSTIFGDLAIDILGQCVWRNGVWVVTQASCG